MAAGTYQHEGGCHCGNVRYVFTAATVPAQWPVRRCTCQYCVRLNARYTSGKDTSLDVVVLYASMVGRYEFGTRTAEFFRCDKCGVMIFASCEIDARRYAVLNVNTLDNAGAMPFDAVDVDFDDENVQDRLGRRQRNWIPNVEIRFVNT